MRPFTHWSIRTKLLAPMIAVVTVITVSTWLALAVATATAPAASNGLEMSAKHPPETEGASQTNRR